jgi:hypothetical protein
VIAHAKFQEAEINCPPDCACKVGSASPWPLSSIAMPAQFASMWIRTTTDLDTVYYWHNRTKRATWDEPDVWRYAIAEVEFSPEETARSRHVRAVMELLLPLLDAMSSQNDR